LLYWLYNFLKNPKFSSISNALSGKLMNNPPQAAGYHGNFFLTPQAAGIRPKEIKRHAGININQNKEQDFFVLQLSKGSHELNY
jgi:hypothetical protein